MERSAWHHALRFFICGSKTTLAVALLRCPEGVLPRVNVELRQRSDDLHCFEADGDHAAEQVKGIGRVATISLATLAVPQAFFAASSFSRSLNRFFHYRRRVP